MPLNSVVPAVADATRTVRAESPVNRMMEVEGRDFDDHSQDQRKRCRNKQRLSW